jgi:hypothetical protein
MRRRDRSKSDRASRDEGSIELHGVLSCWSKFVW